MFQSSTDKQQTHPTDGHARTDSDSDHSACAGASPWRRALARNTTPNRQTRADSEQRQRLHVDRVGGGSAGASARLLVRVESHQLWAVARLTLDKLDEAPSSNFERLVFRRGATCCSALRHFARRLTRAAVVCFALFTRAAGAASTGTQRLVGCPDNNVVWTTLCSPAAHLSGFPSPAAARHTKARSRMPACLKGPLCLAGARCGLLRGLTPRSAVPRTACRAAPPLRTSPGGLCSPGLAPGFQKWWCTHNGPPFGPSVDACTGPLRRDTYQSAGAGRYWGTGCGDVLCVIGVPRPAYRLTRSLGSQARPGQPSRGRGAALAAKEQRPVEGAAPRRPTHC